MSGPFVEAMAAGALLAAAWCGGGLHGLYLAWSQPARMQRFARKVEQLQLKLDELEERGEAR